MTVTGEKNSITAICLSSKDLIPRIANLLSEDMVVKEQVPSLYVGFAVSVLVQELGVFAIERSDALHCDKRVT